jgi:hypothetical protein
LVGKKDLNEILNEYTDSATFDAMEKRMVGLEELIASNKKLRSPKSPKKGKSPSDPGSPGSPGSPSGMEGEEEEDEEDMDDDDDEGMGKAAMAELTKKIEDQEKKF